MSLKEKILGLTKSKGMVETIPLKGSFEIVLRGPDGKIKQRQKKDNLILNTGKGAMASRLNGAGALPLFNYLALGSDNTAAAAAQSLLIAELTGAASSGGQREHASTSRVTTTVTNDTAQLYFQYAIQVSMQIQEVAAFNQSGANNGQVLGRQVVTAINAQSGDTVTVTYKFQF